VRYDAPGSIAGHGEGLGCGRFRVYLATQCAALESQADMPKRGQASPDDGDALALTFAQPVAPAEVEEPDEVEEFGGTAAAATRGGCDDANRAEITTTRGTIPTP
jgi:hypothetical protein